MSKSIACIGNGFVGGSLTTVFTERGYHVYAYDKAGKYVPAARPCSNDGTHFPKSTSALVKKCDAIKGFTGIFFVCLPTPMMPSGDADLSIVISALDEIASVPGDHIAVVKSTIPPGTTEAWNKKYASTGLRVVFNPEFLTEANALEDMRNQNRIILGGPKAEMKKVRDVFAAAFPNVSIVQTTSTTAECVKYFININLCLRVLLCNEFYQIVEKFKGQDMDVDYDKIVAFSMFDKRLGGSHMQVPGPMPMTGEENAGKPAMGVAGSCFVKDLNAFIVIAKQVGVDPKIMSAGWEKNLEVRPERDWEKLIGRAVSDKSE